MVLVEKWPFVQLLFLGNTPRKHVLYDFLELKNVFLS